jgi:uncharacterized membrane protein
MYSKAKIKGHPIHPMLISFPITFYTVSFVCYCLYQFGAANLFFFQAAYASNVAGVVTAVIASIPGLIDWAYGIPNQSGAKRRGVVHMSLNLLALALFALTAALFSGNWYTGVRSTSFAIVLTGVGFLITTAAGAHGWLLIARHKVGVELTPEQERLEPVASLESREGFKGIQETPAGHQPV